MDYLDGLRSSHSIEYVLMMSCPPCWRIESAILEEYINPLGIKLLFNAKTFFCFNGCLSHERTVTP